jgi:hypothetical protein
MSINIQICGSLDDFEKFLRIHKKEMRLRAVIVFP